AVEVVLALPHLHQFPTVRVHALDLVVRQEDAVDHAQPDVDPALAEHNGQLVDGSNETDHPDHAVEFESGEDPGCNRAEGRDEKVHPHDLDTTDGSRHGIDYPQTTAPVIRKGRVGELERDARLSAEGIVDQADFVSEHADPAAGRKFASGGDSEAFDQIG